MSLKTYFAFVVALLFPFVTVAQENDQPNIVMILVDDSALMDFGVYGGEAETPNIDALAARGAMFTQYRTSPLCSPTRAMLLTGVDNHRTGIATIPEVIPPEQKGKRGYSMSLEPTVLTIGDHLRANGYRTLMTGKWHMGETGNDMPHNHGFDRSFALAASGADNWEDKSYMPYYAEAPWYEDGVSADLPEDFYSSKFIIDKMMNYLEETDQTKPFLAYLPFQAIHIPVQAPPEFTAKYKGRFDRGWNELQRARHERAQDLGFIRKGAPLAPMPEDARAWDDLDDETREIYAARMAVNAGMLTAMDHHIGRFVNYLKENGEYENTIFVVTSDNGPEPNRGDHDRRLAIWMKLSGYNIDLDGIGEKGSWGFIGTEWALAASSPGTLYKFYATEGGIRAPLIMAGPGIAPMRVDSPAMVTDVTPTLLDMTRASTDFVGFQSMTGRSLLPVLTGEAETVYGPDDVRAIEVSGNTALYKGDYKILRSVPPIGDGKWQLYNLSDDPGETRDLSQAEPERLQKLLQEYSRYKVSMGVLDMPFGYNSSAQIAANTVKRVRARYGRLFLLIGLVFSLGLWILIRRLRRRQRVK
ncbi:MAG: arylsulfatase [Hellea sp.]|nr:arylsulfatase [Hellea sp.]